MFQKSVRQERQASALLISCFANKPRFLLKYFSLYWVSVMFAKDMQMSTSSHHSLPYDVTTVAPSTSS